MQFWIQVFVSILNYKYLKNIANINLWSKIPWLKTRENHILGKIQFENFLNILYLDIHDNASEFWNPPNQTFIR